VLVREAFGAAGERRFALQHALYRAVLGADWGQLVLAFAWLKRLDDLVDEDPDASRALAVLAEHRALVARIYAGEPIDGALAVPARFAVPFLVWDRAQGSRLRSGVERLLATMEFDAGRRGRVLDAAALAAYERELGATVVCTLADLIVPGIAGRRNDYPAKSTESSLSDAVLGPPLPDPPAPGPGPDPADTVCNQGPVTTIVTPFATKPFSVKAPIKP
jgi:hypothetical protein